jgi:homoserine dehydrogenase
LKPVKLGLLGVGTVGASTALVLKNNAAEIARRAGRSIEIIQASRRSVAAGMPEGSGDIALTADPFEVVNNADVDIVIELIGGYDPARELVLQAILLEFLRGWPVEIRCVLALLYPFYRLFNRTDCEVKFFGNFTMGRTQ